jgi:hypothetical protein
MDTDAVTEVSRNLGFGANLSLITVSTEEQLVAFFVEKHGLLERHHVDLEPD